MEVWEAAPQPPRVLKGNGPAAIRLSENSGRDTSSKRPSGRVESREKIPKTQAVVMHGVPPSYKPGTMRRWIEEDNKQAEIMGIRWMFTECRPGTPAGRP